MNDSHDVTGELRSDDLREWVRDNETAILAWTQTVKMTHYYRRMLLVLTALAFTASSAALSALLLGNPGAFIVDGVSNAELLYRGMVFLTLGNVVAGPVVAVREYSRRKMSTRAATIQAIQIVSDDLSHSQ